MAGSDSSNPDTSPENEKIPWGQQLYDRPFLWLILGMVTMVAFYTLWGIFEIFTLPRAPLP